MEEGKVDPNGKLFKCIRLVLPPAVFIVELSRQYQGKRYFGIGSTIKPHYPLLFFLGGVGGIQ